MYWMLSQKAQQNADLGADRQKMLKMKAQEAVDMAMHLLAIELSLGRHSLELSVENSAAKRRIRTAMQS
jgi:hypothetical protein